MTSDETKRITTALRVKVRYPDIDTFVERFAVNVGRSGLFIPTPTPKPVDSEVRFEIRLADDRAVLIGQGLVRWVREPATDRSRATTGMAIELQRVSKESRDVLLRMLQVRRRRGLVDGPGGLPVIEDEPRDDGDDDEHRASGRRRATIAPPSDTTPPPSAPEPVSVPEPAPVPVSAPDPAAAALAALSAALEPPPERDKEDPFTLSAAPPFDSGLASLGLRSGRTDSASAESKGDERTHDVLASRTIPMPSIPDWVPRPRRQPTRPPPLPLPPTDDDTRDAPDLDNLDLDAIFARARAITSLTSDDVILAGEPAFDAAAVPEPIDIDEASSRLAAMFGTPAPPRRTSTRPIAALPVVIPPLPFPRPVANAPAAAAVSHARAALAVPVPDADGWDDDLALTPPPPPMPAPEPAPLGPPPAAPPTAAQDGTPLEDLADIAPPQRFGGTQPWVAIPPRPPGPVTRKPPTEPPHTATRPTPAPAPTPAPPPAARGTFRTTPPLAGDSPSSARRRLDLDWIERQEVERERAEQERSERERAEQVRVARVELATIDPLAEPLDDDVNDTHISLAESLKVMDPAAIELAPAMGYLDDLELDDRRGRRGAAAMPLAPPRAQIPPAAPARLRRGSTPPPPPRSVPIPAATPAAPSTPRPTAFTGRSAEPAPRATGSVPGEVAPTGVPRAPGAPADAFGETTAVSGPLDADRAAPAEVDLDVESDVVIEFDDAP